MESSPHLLFDKIGDTQAKQPQNNMNNHIRLSFPYRNLTNLDLSYCNLGDEGIGSSVCELPNVQELNLQANNFSRLDFSLLRVPKLKWLNVTNCIDLVELSDLPSSIAVVWAGSCSSLETFGDISSCKWLWEVWHKQGYNMDQFEGEILLDSMLQGNAIEDHFINVNLGHQIPMGFVARLLMGKAFTKRLPFVRRAPRMRHDSDTFTLRLPDDWYNEFCGFLIRVVTQSTSMYIDIVMKREADEEDFGFEIWRESDEAPEPEYDGKVMTRVGYVSFNSLRRTTLLNSSYNLISFVIKSYWTSFTAELVPRKSKDDPVKIDYCSEFGNKGSKRGSGFGIKQVSKSSIKILW